MTAIATLDNASDTALVIESVSIYCNSAKGEIRTVVKHEAESFRIGDASENRTDERVTISEREFPTYGRSPGHATEQLARHMARYTRSTLPNVPVCLYGA